MVREQKHDLGLLRDLEPLNAIAFVVVHKSKITQLLELLNDNVVQGLAPFGASKNLCQIADMLCNARGALNRVVTIFHLNQDRPTLEARLTMC